MSMVNHILHAFRQFAVQAVVRSLSVVRVDGKSAEPRIRSLQPDTSDLDDLLFDRPTSRMAAASDQMGRELLRVSSGLIELRGLLSSLSRLEPSVAAEINAVAGSNYGWSEDVLFEGDAFSVPADPVLSVEGEANFLFDDDAPKASWSVLGSQVMGLQHA